MSDRDHDSQTHDMNNSSIEDIHYMPVEANGGLDINAKFDDEGLINNSDDEDSGNQIGGAAEVLP
jgi:hypothetical protein